MRFASTEQIFFGPHRMCSFLELHDLDGELGRRFHR
jgi:hypothetical protein